jgi:hypothetical protein
VKAAEYISATETGVIGLSIKLMSMKSVLCEPSTGLLDGGGGVVLEVVWNVELLVAGSIGLDSRPHAQALFTRASLANGRSSVADRCGAASFCRCANDVLACDMSNAITRNASSRTEHTVFMYLCITVSHPGAPAL